MLTEPHIDPALLAKVQAPTLVLSSDHDLILLSHTVEIYEHLPNAELVVFPNSTHMVAWDNPAMFNGAVETFLTTPYVKLDRIPATLATLEKIEKAKAE